LCGCAVVREFKAALQAAALTPGEASTRERGDIPTSGKLGAAAAVQVRVRAVDAGHHP